MDYLILFGPLFGLNLVNGFRYLSHSFCHVQRVNLPCLDSIGLPPLFDLDWIKFYDLIQLVFFGLINKLSLIQYSLLLIIIYAQVFFPLPSHGSWLKTIPIMFR